MLSSLRIVWPASYCPRSHNCTDAHASLRIRMTHDGGRGAVLELQTLRREAFINVKFSRCGDSLSLPGLNALPGKSQLHIREYRPPGCPRPNASSPRLARG